MSISGGSSCSRAAIAAVAAFILVVVAPAAADARPSAPAAAGPSFVFQGGGFGHGVGMSQYGARGQGDAGRAAAQILASYYPGTSLVTGFQPGPTVLLANGNCAGTAAAYSTTLQPSGGGIEIFVNGPSYGGYAGITGVASGTTATVSVTGQDSAYYRVQAPGIDYSFGTRSDFLLVALHGVPTYVGMTDHRYSRGNLVLRENGGGMLAGYAQDMTMDEYLYGLGEVPSSWPIETLKAQAVAGRTYAERVAKPRRDAGSRFHIYGSTLDQCYQGYSKEEGSLGARWKSAVDATSGQVLLYGSTLAQTFYSSSNGGHSERSGYVFSQDLPYLPAQPDGYDNATGNSLYRWSRTFDGSTLGARIGGVGTVTNLSVSGPVGASGRINKATVSVTGTDGSRTMTGSQLRSYLGLPDTLIFGILRDGTAVYGQVANQLPAGSFDSAVVSGTSATVEGWAADPDSSASVEIDVYVNGAFAGYGYANQSRPDVGAAIPAYGSNRGFSFAVPVPAGSSSVCVYAIDANISAANRSLGCRTVSRSSGNPIGNAEALVRVPGGAQIQGWALDPDTASPVEVHAYANGRLVGYGYAAAHRPDIDAAYPGYGPNHGFALDTTLPSGQQTVCAYAINVPAGPNPLLGCRSIDVSPVPIGNLDALVRSGDRVSAQGWTLDPDTAAGIEVHVLVDGQLGGWGYANLSRSDIGAAFSPYGSNHGFDISMPVAAGPHTVCAYGINEGPGVANRFLGCVNL